MAIKDLLRKTADKYKVAITYQENSALPSHIKESPF